MINMQLTNRNYLPTMKSVALFKLLLRSWGWPGSSPSLLQRICFIISVAPTIKRPPRIISIVNKKVIIETIIVSTSKPACHWERNSSKVKMDSRHGITVVEVGGPSHVRAIEEGEPILMPRQCRKVKLFHAKVDK